jgi:hypothetical protein
MTRDEKIQKAIDDIKDIALVLTDPREWARQEAIKELKRKELKGERES